MTASPGDVSAWLLAMDTADLAEGLVRLNALIAVCDKAFDALLRLRLDVEWVPDPTLLWKARTAAVYALEIRDELQAARRRLEA